jgi:hypothetical protein
MTSADSRGPFRALPPLPRGVARAAVHQSVGQQKGATGSLRAGVIYEYRKPLSVSDGPAWRALSAAKLPFLKQP